MHITVERRYSCQEIYLLLWIKMVDQLKYLPHNIEATLKLKRIYLMDSCIFFRFQLNNLDKCSVLSLIPNPTNRVFKQFSRRLFSWQAMTIFLLLVKIARKKIAQIRKEKDDYLVKRLVKSYYTPVTKRANFSKWLRLLISSSCFLF